MKPNIIISYIYKKLLQQYTQRDTKWWKQRWAYYISANPSVTLQIKVHGHKILVNNGYTYPLYTRIFPTLNNPLLELVHQSYMVRQNPLYIIDVGAAVGDTFLFIHTNCAEAIEQFYCIDGDATFFDYLQHNLKNFPQAILINTLLSEKEENIPNLVRIHKGTASSQGNVQVKAHTLDQTMQTQNVPNIDILKVDVDGFDGKVLKGASHILQQYRPSIIFEWHPVLYEKTNNDIFEPFDFLKQMGYNHFLFYSNFGDFCAYHHSPLSETDLNRYAKISYHDAHTSGWHYDVIALHEDTNLDIDALAVMSFAKNKKSFY